LQEFRSCRMGNIPKWQRLDFEATFLDVNQFRIPDARLASGFLPASEMIRNSATPELLPPARLFESRQSLHSNTPVLQPSSAPTLRHSNTPILQYSNTPLIHRSVNPLLHHSILPGIQETSSTPFSVSRCWISAMWRRSRVSTVQST
jgi:hypothetical protein